MTREEQRILREREKTLEKNLKKTCKETGKRRGWKTVSGEQYQVRDSFLYILYIAFPTSLEREQVVKADLRCKPLVVDEMYWNVFQMAEEAAKQPFSFHVTGAFTARGLWLPPRKEPLSAPEEPEAAVEAIFDWAEELMGKDLAFPDLPAYRERLETAEHPKALEIILCLLCEGQYAGALERIEAELSRGETGGFSRLNGRRSILEDARDWCAARLREAEE